MSVPVREYRVRSGYITMSKALQTFVDDVWAYTAADAVTQIQVKYRGWNEFRVESVSPRAADDAQNEDEA